MMSGVDRKGFSPSRAWSGHKSLSCGQRRFSICRPFVYCYFFMKPAFSEQAFWGKKRCKGLARVYNTRWVSHSEVNGTNELRSEYIRRLIVHPWKEWWRWYQSRKENGDSMMACYTDAIQRMIEKDRIRLSSSLHREANA